MPSHTPNVTNIYSTKDDYGWTQASHFVESGGIGVRAQPWLLATYFICLSGFGLYITIVAMLFRDAYSLLLAAFVETTSAYSTRAGCRGSQSSSINNECATLMNPNKGKTVACGSSIFFCWMTEGRHSLVAIYMTLVSQPH